jgi:hypothetical protein
MKELLEKINGNGEAEQLRMLEAGKNPMIVVLK